MRVLRHFDTQRLDIAFVSFCVPTVSIPPEQNASILFMNNVYIDNIRTVWHRKLYMKI